MKRYFRLLGILTKLNFMRQTAYRPSFIVGVFGKTLRIGLYLVFADAIFRNIPEIHGWTRANIPFLILTLALFETSTGITFHRNLLFWLPDLIKKGKYDHMLIRPVSPIFYTSFRVIDSFDMIPFLLTLGVFIWYLAVHKISIMVGFGYAILFIIGNIILFSFNLILSSVNFWTIVTTGTGRLFESIERFNRFPLDVLPKFWRVALFYVVPVAVAGNIPAKFLIGTWSWWQLLYIVAFAAFIFWLAVKFWYRALRHYSSVA